MKIQILLTGSFGVGKTSIFNRFIHKNFDDKYYGTIGVRVNEQVLQVEETKVTIELWDLAGEVKQEKIPLNYFAGKDTVFYVVDLCRPFTFNYIADDLLYLNKNLKDTQILVVGNKKDLLTDQEIEELKSKYPNINFDWMTSAKNGDNIEELFQFVAKHQMTTRKTTKYS